MADLLARYAALWQETTSALSRASHDGGMDLPFFHRAMETAFAANGFRAAPIAGIEHILIARLDAVGDTILTSGFIREVRANYPQAHITLVVQPDVYPLVELCPYVNEVLAYRRQVPTDNIAGLLTEVASFCRDRLWQHNFSLAFSPQWGSDNYPPLYMNWLSGATERVGYGKNIAQIYAAALGIETGRDGVDDTDRCLLTQNAKNPPEVTHEAARCFWLLTSMGLRVRKTNLELWYDKNDSLAAEKFLSGQAGGPLVSVGIGAGSGSRKYPAAKLAVALRPIAESGATLVLLGGKGELAEAAYLANNLPAGQAIDLVGKTTLRETAAVIAHTDVHIGNSTGTLHMAAAARVPTIGIFREAKDKSGLLDGILSEVARFAPWQVPAFIMQPEQALGACAQTAIYGGCQYSEPHCIAQIPPEEISAAYALLSRYLRWTY